MSARLREYATSHLEVGAQLRKIVDLTVERDDDLPVGAEHRLRAGLRQIDDRQAAVTESDPSVFVRPFAIAVGTARSHRVPRPAQFAEIDRRAFIRKQAVDSARDWSHRGEPLAGQGDARVAERFYVRLPQTANHRLGETTGQRKRGRDGIEAENDFTRKSTGFRQPGQLWCETRRCVNWRGRETPSIRTWKRALATTAEHGASPNAGSAPKGPMSHPDAVNLRWRRGLPPGRRVFHHAQKQGSVE